MYFNSLYQIFVNSSKLQKGCMFLLYFSFLHSNKYPTEINRCSLVFGSITHSKSELISLKLYQGT